MLERKGDHDGRAQMRLAEIYGKGNTAVKRDYAKALYRYEKPARRACKFPSRTPT